MNWFRQGARPDEIILFVRAKPRASRSRVVGLTAEKDALEVALAAPPVDGAANDELVDFLSEVLSIRKSAIEISKGGQSRHKQVILRGVSESRLHALVGASESKK